MTWFTRTSASVYETKAGFSRTVANDQWVFVAGTTGFDYETMTLPEGVYEQTVATWRNVAAALEAAGSSLDEVVNYTMVLTDAADLDEATRGMLECLTNRPAGMCIVSDLVSPALRYEVQVVAARGARLMPAED